MTGDLPDVVVAGIRAALRRHPAVERAILFGSRAVGRGTARSDIDIALQGNVSPLEAARIALDLDELPILSRFDVVSYETISSPALREHIDRAGLVLYERPTDTATLPTRG